MVVGGPQFVSDLRKAVSAQRSALSNAVARFRKGCSNLITDSIVDFVIVLDVVLGHGLQNEITHRVAARGAYLLEAAANERINQYVAPKYVYGCGSKFVPESAADVMAPNGKERAALEALSVAWRNDDRKTLNRYHVAEFARKMARSVLWMFIRVEAQLDHDWLTQLELGLVKPDAA